MKKKVVIGLSGGIDSSMAALMLKQQGYEVIGLHFLLVNQKESILLNPIAKKLGIEVVNIDISKDFEIVKQHFANEYLGGRTPSSCTFCNKVIKWNKLLEYADNNNCDYVSSGHYIRKIEKNGKYYLKKGLDPVKDQSYCMWELESETIKRMLSPLGDFTKKEVREFAIKNGFNDLAAKKESMGVCFLENLDYRDFLRNYIPNKIEKLERGDVIDEKGELVGSHDGYIYYTVGQKRGLKLLKPRQAYVSAVDPDKNTLTIGTKDSLNHYNIVLKDLHLINQSDLLEGDLVSINIRGLGLNPEEKAKIVKFDKDTIQFELSKPAWAVAPGQPVVIYRDDIILGGGIAEKSW